MTAKPEIRTILAKNHRETLFIEIFNISFVITEARVGYNGSLLYSQGFQHKELA